jgi:ADP-dependent NAD(P)H-hydrate dehydratase
MKKNVINAKFIKQLLPSRTNLSNKTDGGKVLIIGGAKGLYGAGILSALAATRSGAGYTHLMCDLNEFPLLKYPDFIVHPLKISELRGKEDFVVAIGPGLGLTNQKNKFMNYLIKNNFKKVLLDADALTLLSQENVKKLPTSWLLTPHVGELSRLINVSSKKINENREYYLTLAQKKYGCSILLKGTETLVIDFNQNISRITEGTSSLAKAGTGDVLLGIIAAMRAQNLEANEAAILGAFIHGRASQAWEKEKNDHLSMRPVDLIERLPKVIKRLRILK